MTRFQRLFFAVPVTGRPQRELDSFLEQARAKELPVRWVRSEGLHITLYFFGNISEDKSESLCEIARSCVNQAAPFSIGLKGLGCFPSEDKPHVLWARVNGDLEPLFELHSRLCQNLEAAGFPLETRSFTPHVTLGRSKGTLPFGVLNALEFPQTSLEVVKSIALYKSVSDMSGKRYEILQEFPFSKIA